MKRFSKTVVRTLGFACSGLAAASAQAATPRAYVSVNGSDSNTCNVPATPCRTYTGAITQVTPGGTVVVMDSGTFGGGTITQSVTINAPSGVLALAATPIVVNPGAGNVVVLRGLTFQAGSPGVGFGITHQSGVLFVENSVLNGWGIGLSSQSGGEKLFVTGSAFRNNTGSGLFVNSGSTATIEIDHSIFENNTGYAGIAFEGGRGRITNSVMSGNSHGAVIENAGAEAYFERCVVSNNTYGLLANMGALLRLSGTSVTRSAFIGVHNSLASTIESFGNNVVRGNGTETSGIVTTVALQ